MVLRSNSFDQFGHRLSTLWDMRHQYQSAFAETINSLQNLISGRSETFFSPSEISTLRSAVALLFDAKEIDDVLANEVTAMLAKGGLDVFREID